MDSWFTARGIARVDGDTVKIQLPDIRQDEDSAECALVAASIVWQHFGTRTRIIPNTPLDGTSPDTLESVLWESGLSVISGSMDLDDLRYHTRRGRPVISLVTEHDGTGHYVVVCGVERNHVYYQCPLDGPTKERSEDFEVRWQDRTRRGVAYSHWGIAVQG